MTLNFYKKYVIVVVVVVGIIFFNNFLFGNFLQNTFYKIITKPGTFINKNLPLFSELGREFFKTRRLVEENAKIREENNLLFGKLSQLENLKRENQFLRDQLGVARKSDPELLIVQAFNIQHGGVSSTILINKGKDSGILKSMPVIAAGNVLVGIVDEVFNNSSSVFLLDDPRAKISGRIQDSRILIKTVGRLGDKLGLDLVAASDDIKEGNIVVTSGLDGLPESLLVARVSKIESPDGALFKTVIARPLFDPSLGSSLFVIIK